jgi:hypothetical protein
MENKDDRERGTMRSSDISTNGGQWNAGWKVVLRKKIYDVVGNLADITFMSATGHIDQLAGPDTIIYCTGKIIKPNDDCGPLCVFPDFDDAWTWTLIEYEGEDEEYSYSIIPVLYKSSKAKEIWYKTSRHRKLADLPDGTVLADIVICHH